MVSPHVAIGRQNLAANTITLMRRIGMSAFQTVRVPSLTRDEVKALNHADTADPLLHRIDVAREIERALAVTAPVLTEAGYAVRFAGNLLEVMLNVRQWNRDLEGYVACASFNLNHRLREGSRGVLTLSTLADLAALGVDDRVIEALRRLVAAGGDERAVVVVFLQALADGPAGAGLGRQARRVITHAKQSVLPLVARARRWQPGGSRSPPRGRSVTS